MPTIIFYITKEAYTLSKKIKSLYPEATIIRYKRGILSEHWDKNRLLIFIMATGIVVRAIAHFIRDKSIDPAVVVIDEKGRFVISLLSGHLGGANEYTRELAGFLKAQAVITTGSDINNLTAIDLWAKRNNLAIENRELLPPLCTKLIDNKKLKVYLDTNLKLPREFIKISDPEEADIIITNKIDIETLRLTADCENSLNSLKLLKLKKFNKKQLILRPKNLVVGIGLNSNTEAEEIEKAVKEIMRENNFSFFSIRYLATLDRKASEKGLVAFSKKYSLEIRSFTPKEINEIDGIEVSERVFKATGAKAVAEPCALLASNNGRLLLKKQRRGNVTLSLAEISLQEINEQLC